MMSTQRETARALPGAQTSEMDSFSTFQAAMSRTFVPLRVTSERPDPFRARVRSSRVDGIHLCEIGAGAQLVERTPQLIGSGDCGYYKLSLQVAGTGLLVQDNREALMRPGDIAIYDTNRPYSLFFEDDFRTTVVMFPQELIALPVTLVGQLTAVCLSGDGRLASIIAPFLTQIAKSPELFSGSLGVRLSRNTLDLVTTMLASYLDLERGDLSNGHRPLVQEIFDYIDDNLSSPELSPRQIAAAHYISTRKLHNVFGEQGTTVASWIRKRRLERCRFDLLDPVYASSSIATIAARWGFRDAAHFSRVFKGAFDRSPSELRSEVYGHSG